MSLKYWVLKKLLHNFGITGEDTLHRSGQPSLIGLYFHYWLFPFKSVINLAYAPDYDKDDLPERRFCDKRGIHYFVRSWGAGGAPIEDVLEVVEALDALIESGRSPVWIHCEGGKDRTGGLIGMWKKKHGYSMELIFKDFDKHKIPAWRWVEMVLSENVLQG